MLAVGAYGEDSNATGVGGHQANDLASSAGAVYVFARDGMDQWSQEAYVKASNTGAGDQFGYSIALSGDGGTLAVGAHYEGLGVDDSAPEAGAAYVFVRGGIGLWSQQAYIKPSNTGAGDGFGGSIALSEDGDMLAVGARFEDSGAIGVGGDEADNSTPDAGAVYVFVRSHMETWSQRAYVKASSTNADDSFGFSCALSGDGHSLVIGAHGEDSSTTGIGSPDDKSATDSGVVYID